MSFSVKTYTGPFPVLGSYDPDTQIFDDAGSQTHQLVSERLVLPYSASVPSATEYIQAINIGDWVASAGYSTISIPAATHLLAASPDTVNVFRTVGADYEEVLLDAILINSTTHDVVLRITTGAEFSGRVVIKT